MGQVSGKVKPAGLDVTVNQVIKSGFIDGNDALNELIDLLFIGVDTPYSGSQFSEAGTLEQSDIVGSDDGNIHDLSKESKCSEVDL